MDFRTNSPPPPWTDLNLKPSLRYLGQSENRYVTERMTDIELDTEEFQEKKQNADSVLLFISSLDKGAIFHFNILIFSTERAKIFSGIHFRQNHRVKNSFWHQRVRRNLQNLGMLYRISRYDVILNDARYSFWQGCSTISVSLHDF